jgi:acetylornithine deacetylase/succinyl-diaminopimelate desuccinylase-like protein
MTVAARRWPRVGKVAGEAAAGWAGRHAAAFLSELQEFVRFPSVSADPARATDVASCARWLAKNLLVAGFDRVTVAPTPGHPAVLASWRRRPGRPTVLIYGHYDVQPADVADGWHSPPFEPIVRDGYLYGRGASDDKGQLFAHVKAFQTASRVGDLPVNVVCVFEGEEEIGSPHLASLLQANRRALQADIAVISDTRMLGSGRPTLVYSLRGGLGLELTVRGAHEDLHSGGFGGAVPNPLESVCEIVAGLSDDVGRIAVPGFYDRVRRWGSRERAFMAREGPTDREILHSANATRGRGEPGYSLYERTTIRPTLTVNGVGGGYAGPGGKGVIPSEAWAKLSFRLVPDQDPADIRRRVLAHIRRRPPPGTRSEIRTNLSVPPALVSRDHPAMLAAARAYVRGFGAEPAFVRSGGSIPAVTLFRERLGIHTVLMGFALPDDRMHGTNERFKLTNFHRGVRTSLAFLEELA